MSQSVPSAARSRCAMMSGRPSGGAIPRLAGEPVQGCDERQRPRPLQPDAPVRTCRPADSGSPSARCRWIVPGHEVVVDDDDLKADTLRLFQSTHSRCAAVDRDDKIGARVCSGAGTPLVTGRSLLPAGPARRGQAPVPRRGNSARGWQSWCRHRRHSLRRR
jgi:hypothetical protein